MRLIYLLALMLLPTALPAADVQWHTFGESGDKDTLTISQVALTVEAVKDSNSQFPGDDLVITAHAPGQASATYHFSSAYGYGAVAVYKNFLFLKYGVGRGNWARVDHVKALRLDHGLDEVVDVQSSFYVLTSSHNAAPDLFEYRLRVQPEGDYTRLSFVLSRRAHGIPSERIVKLKTAA